MRMTTRRLWLGGLLLVMLVGMTGVSWAKTAVQPWQPSRVFDLPWFQKNQWRVTISNYGTFGYAVGSPGGEWPAGSGDMYIYGAGIWIGSIRRSTTGRDTLASVGYNPNSGASEMTPGCYDNAPGGYSSREFERVYMFPEDWPPNLAEFPADLSDSVLTPLRIPSGDTVVPGYFHYIPRDAVSSGDAWTVFNDRDETQHVAGSTPRAIGVEVYQSTYAWTLPWNQDIVFFKLDVRNRTSDTIYDMYLGMVCDADVGNSTDDRAGLALSKYIHSPDGGDSVFVDNMGYVWSDDGIPSGVCGFDFLQSPFVKDEQGNIVGFDGLDNNGNGLIDEPAEGEQLGMTAFKIFTLNDADPVDDFQQYLALAGHDYWDPEYPYNPYDSTDQAPADKRFLQSTGPFVLAPNEIVTVTIGLIAADRTAQTGEEMLYGIAQASRAAQAAYDNNWIMPEPPPSPGLTLVPGDGRVTLIWDDLPEDAVDRFFPVAPALFNPYYVEQDFQGYKVYRSQTGQPGDWELLTQFDRVDGITFEDTTVVESLRTLASDVGLSYSYVDSSGLRLGFPYHYAVTSFDINYLSGDPDTNPPIPPDTLTLESGMSGQSTVPRTEAGNYRPPEAEWWQMAGNTDVRVSVVPFAVTPHAVADESFLIRFLSTAYDADDRLPVYRFFIEDENGDTAFPVTTFSVDLEEQNDTFQFVNTLFDSVVTLVAQETTTVYDSTVGGWRDSIYVDTTRAWLPVSQMTVKLQMDQIPKQFFREVTVLSGSYPEDSLTVVDLANNPALWAYRGSDYRIVWRQHSCGNLTCDVFDLDNELEVPYKMYPLVGGDPDSADAWCFRSVREAGDTIGLDATWYMYLCGSQFGFQPRGAIKVLPEVGDTWVVYTRDLSPAPSFSEFKVEFSAMEYVTDTDSAELDVKVVPNPYLVRNEWERHPDFRKLKFINLPNHCTIRIYNLAGDLVRTLEHDETNPGIGGLPNQYGGDEDWDLLNESQQKPAPGLYIFHVDSDQGTQVGKFVVIY